MVFPNEIDIVRKKKKKEKNAFIMRNYGINFLYILCLHKTFLLTLNKNTIQLLLSLFLSWDQYNIVIIGYKVL